MRQGYVLALDGTYWPNAAWYAFALNHNRHPSTWKLEVRLANFAVSGGIVFG